MCIFGCGCVGVWVCATRYFCRPPKKKSAPIYNELFRILIFVCLNIEGTERRVCVCVCVCVLLDIFVVKKTKTKNVRARLSITKCSVF